MEKKIVLEHTSLLKLDNNTTHHAGAVAVAIAMKRPGSYQPHPGDPNTSPCWLAAVLATERHEDVDKARESFGSAVGIDPKELKNVITAKTGGDSDRLARALEQLGGTRAPSFLGTNISIFSCSIGGRGTSVFIGAITKPTHFDATWALAKGTKLSNGDCACKEVRVWTRDLTADETKEFNYEVSTFDGFKCD